MQNNIQKKNNSGSQDNTPISQAATLAVLAGLITTLGDGLATVAAALAIQESQQQSGSNGNGVDNANIQKMQQQIDYLTREVKKLKRY